MNQFKYIVVLLLIWAYPVTTNAQELSKNEVNAIINKIPELIEKHYVLEEKRKAISNAFAKAVSSKKYEGIKNPDSLSKQLTKDLRAISNDKHLYVEHLDNSEEEEFDWEAWEKEERAQEKKLNFGFTEIKILEGNVGYLKIVEFMHPQRGMQTAVAAMKFLENTESLIIDLRGNGGGYSGLMQYIMNHYFDGGPTHISTNYYSGKNEIPSKEYSSDLVYGKLRVDTPLYIIVDGKTGSAAEFFAYTLQSFDKAVIIGQPTAGAAHRNSFYPLPGNFRISISTAAPINPKTNTNWETTGVIPDHSVRSNEIDYAMELIKKRGKISDKK